MLTSVAEYDQMLTSMRTAAKDSSFDSGVNNGRLEVYVNLSEFESDNSRATFFANVRAALITSKSDTVVLDFADHDDLSSSTLSDLIRLGRGVDVWLRNPTPHVLEILERTKLIEMFHIQRNGGDTSRKHHA